MASQFPEDFLNSVMTATNLTPPQPVAPALPQPHPLTLENAPQQMQNVTDKAMTSADELMGLSQQIQDATNVRQEHREAALKPVIALKQGLAEEQSQALDVLTGKIKPVIQKKSQSTDQLNKLSTMNPFVRGLKAIFDPNYDIDHVKGKIDTYDGIIGAYGKDYSEMTKIQDERLRLATTMADNATAEDSLHLQNLSEDQQSVLGVLSASNAMGETIQKGVAGQIQAIQAKNVAAAQELDQLTPADAVKYLGRAKENGGSVLINGHTVGYQDLNAVVQRHEDQQFAQWSHSNAKREANLQMEQQSATRYARSLTLPQLQDAIRNGGKVNGMQLPMDILANNAQQLMSYNKSSAERLTLMSDPHTLAQSGRLASDLIKNSYTKFSGFMKADPTMQAAGLTAAKGVQGVMQSVAQLQQKGGTPEEFAALQAKLDSIQGGYVQRLQGRVDNFVGGDPLQSRLVTSFITGQEIDKATALSGFLSAAKKGAIPGYMSGSPRAIATFKIASDSLVQARKELVARGGKFNEGDIDRLATQMMSSKVPESVIDSNFDHFQSALPQLAQKAGDPFGKIPQETYQRSANMADQAATRKLASALDVSVEDAALIASGRYHPEPGSEPDKKWQRNQSKLTQALQDASGVHNSTLLRALDAEPQADARFKNSQLFSNFINSGHAARFASNYDSSLKVGGVADFMAGSASAGAFAGRFGEWASTMKRQSFANDHTAIEKSRQMLNYFGTPDKYAAAVLGATPGLDAHQEAMVLNALKAAGAFHQPESDATISSNEMGGPIVSVSGVSAQQRVTSSLQNLAATTKDPQLKKVLKIANDSWNDHAGSLERGLARLNGEK